MFVILKAIMNILRSTVLIIGLLSINQIFASEVSFIGSPHEVLEVTPEKNTGLDKIYVAYDSDMLSQMIIRGAGTFKISKFSNLGGGYAQEINFRIEDGNAIIDKPEGDMGYIIENNGHSLYIWLVDYKSHKLNLQSAYASPQQDCDMTFLTVEGEGRAIHYYSIDGRQCELNRDIKVKYNNLEWNQEEENYNQVEITKIFSHINGQLTFTPPLYCNSIFEISGDRFLEKWNMGIRLSSQLVYANGISSQTKATQVNAPDDSEDAEASNMIRTEVAGIGGSAPVEMSFEAWVTDAVIHNEWQIASDEQFEYIDYRFNQQNLDYTFNEEGTYFVRYVGSNADGSCETYGETYTIGVGTSELRIPNAFTPNGDGINDVWKVGYRSLLSFRCTIFDRYGNQLFEFSDPTQGWDGKYKGKLVKPGVYFYVIEAQGADGHKYKKGGDINIIKSKRYSATVDGGAVSPGTSD